MIFAVWEIWPRPLLPPHLLPLGAPSERLKLTKISQIINGLQNYAYFVNVISNGLNLPKKL